MTVKFEFRHVFTVGELLILQPENLQRTNPPNLYPYISQQY